MKDNDQKKYDPSDDILVAMADDLLSSDDGNIQMQAITRDGESRSLFCHRTVLSRLQAARILQKKFESVRNSINQAVFNSSFAEGTAPAAPDSNEIPAAWCPRHYFREKL